VTQFQTQAPPQANTQVPIEWFNYVIRTTISPEAACEYLNIVLALFCLTGQWPTVPPTEDQTPRTTIANNIQPTTPNQTQTKSEILANQKPGTASFYYQPPLPQMLNYFWRVAEEKPEGKIRTKYKIAERYDYANSPYFLEAQRLIKESNSPDVNFNCQKVLTLIIAWTHFELFNGMGNRKGEWMTLPAQKCAREIKMRRQDFARATKALQTAGIHPNRTDGKD
jgi:hypothetical protein